MPARIPSYRPPRLRTAPRRDETNRPNAAARGYCSKAHRKWRQAVLTRDAWKCSACGVVCQRMAQADHIVPINQGGARFDVENGQTLCIACHGRKTRREQAGEASQLVGAAASRREAASAGAAGPAGEGGSDHPNFAQ